MRKIINRIGALALLTFAVGCASNTKQIGTIGNTTFYRVRAAGFASPSFSALVSENGDTVKVEQVLGGPGLGPAAISAVGQVGSSVVLGTSFPRFPKNVGDNVSVSGGNSNGGNGGTAIATGTGGNAGANSNATGGNGNGGNATGGSGGTANGGGQFVPPGHINNPGGNPHNP